MFDATFSPWTETRNDFAAGFDKLVTFDGDFHLLTAAARSRAAAVWRVGLSMFVQLRQRTPGPGSTALCAAPAITYVPGLNWSISLLVNSRERWFDRVASTPTARRDFEIEPILTIVHDPRRSGVPQIALQASFERRSSNLSNRSWDLWIVGPMLTANWRF